MKYRNELWSSGFATVAPNAEVKSQVNTWTKIGEFAKVGKNCELGLWSTIGPLARIQHNVKFGNWAAVGMCSIVVAGVVLDTYEYVPSGHIRTWWGNLKLPIFSDEDWKLFRLYDKIFGNRGGIGMTFEEAEFRDETTMVYQNLFSSTYPEFLLRNHRTKLARSLGKKD